MRRIRHRKGYIAGAAAMLLVLSGMYLPRVFAAGAVDMSRSCTLTLTIAEDSLFSQELSDLSLSVKLYRVGGITETGSYTPVSGYEDLKLDQLEAEEDSEWAELWEEKADKAADAAKKRTPDVEITMKNGATQAETLQMGMYLVMADSAQSPEYEYSFTPYLISLPNNLYAGTGNDDWVYDVTAGLKPGQEPRYGDLIIRKTLQSYNTTFPDATFVFQVEAVKDGKNVYSNVVSTRHNVAGTVEAIAEHIPAGAEVTVKEVYNGASYQLLSDSEQTAVIIAEGMEGAPASVDFVNGYDSHLKPGYGVTNHFEYDENEGWLWEQREDNRTGEE